MVRDQVVADIAKTMLKPDTAERNPTFGYEVLKLSPQAFADPIARGNRQMARDR